LNVFLYRTLPLWEKGENTEKQPVAVYDVAGGITAIAKDPKNTAGKTYQFVGYKINTMHFLYNLTINRRLFSHKMLLLTYVLYMLCLYRPKRYKLSDLLDWFHRIRIHDPVEYGYKRIDLKYAPLFKLKVSLNEFISLAYPLGNLQWERLERVCFNFITPVK